MTRQRQSFSGLFGGALIGMVAFTGCGSPTTSIEPNRSNIPTGTSAIYSDRDLEVALGSSVRDGRVNYERLKREREPLERYLGLISVVGPNSTPQQFGDQADVLCYYVNAYNACTLRAVLDNYPTSSVYGRKQTSIEYGYFFKVDRKRFTLGQLRDRLMTVSKGDARLLFTLSTAALGSPPLADRPYRSASLNDQVRRNIDSVVSDPNLMRIDHGQREVYLWYTMLSRKSMLLDQLKQVSGHRGDKVVEYLMHWSSDAARARLRSCSTYDERRLPFNRELNDVSSMPASQAAIPQE